MSQIVLLLLHAPIKDYGIVVMANVFILLGNVMVGVTALMERMKLIVPLPHVKIKDYGIVVMASVFQQAMYVMDQLIPVTQAGVLTVLMAQMKT